MAPHLVFYMLVEWQDDAGQNFSMGVFLGAGLGKQYSCPSLRNLSVIGAFSLKVIGSFWPIQNGLQDIIPIFDERYLKENPSTA